MSGALCPDRETLRSGMFESATQTDRSVFQSAPEVRPKSYVQLRRRMQSCARRLK
jgi:hypothetical protein